jgi:hypothetical protein
MVESGKEKPMPPARPSDEPDPKAINRLMKDFKGSDKKASKCAFEALVRLGSPRRRWAAAAEKKTKGHTATAWRAGGSSGKGRFNEYRIR